MSPSRWRRGLGRALLDVALAREEDATVWVFAENDRARSFYAALGFADDDAQAVDPRTGVLEVRMRRHGSYARAGVEVLTSRVLLRPTDLGRSLRFYEQTIGLAIYREWGTGPTRGVVFFLGGGGLLEISGTSPEPPSPAICLVLQVRNVKATQQRLTEQGVALDAAPEHKPWGLIEMTVRDPDGLALIIVEVPPEHPRRRG